MSVDKKIPYTQLATSEDAPPPAYAETSAERATSFSTVLARTQQAILAHPTVQFAQPTPRAAMSVESGGERNAKGLAMGNDGRREWNHGLCACYETPGTALAAMCCPCFVYASNHSKLNHLNATGEPIPSPKHVSLMCGLYTLSPQLFGVGQVIMQCFSRLQTRQRYAIRGDIVQDALIAGFCVPCSLVQEAREIEDEENALRNLGTLALDGEEGAIVPAFRDEEERL